MSTTEYTLSDFTVGCGGNWQNAIFIPCGHCSKPCSIRRCGCLMSGSRSGEPILISVKRYERMTGHRINPVKCDGTLSRATFESAYGVLCPCCTFEVYLFYVLESQIRLHSKRRKMIPMQK